MLIFFEETSNPSNPRDPGSHCQSDEQGVSNHLQNAFCILGSMLPFSEGEPGSLGKAHGEIRKNMYIDADSIQKLAVEKPPIHFKKHV